MHSNCLIFVIKKVWQKGGYIIVRKSRYTWVPHFIWTQSIDEVEIEDFVPLRPINNRFLRLFPVFVLVFRGRIRKQKGDAPEGF